MASNHGKRKARAEADAKRRRIVPGARVHVEYEGNGTVVRTDYPEPDVYGNAANVLVRVDSDGLVVQCGLAQLTPIDS